MHVQSRPIFGRMGFWARTPEDLGLSSISLHRPGLGSWQLTWNVVLGQDTVVSDSCAEAPGS